MTQSLVHELLTLIRSGYPLIVVETVEEQRVHAVMESVTRHLGTSLMQWSATKGLVSGSTQGGILGNFKAANPETTDPQELLKELEGAPQGQVFLLKDFAPALKDTQMTRLFREVLQKFSTSHSTVILVGSEIVLPSEVEHMAMFFDFKLPDRLAMEQLFDLTVRGLPRRGRERVDLSADERQQMIEALLGLTLNQARQTINYCYFKDQRICVKDVKIALEHKARAIADSGLLEYYPLEDNDFHLGGFRGLKDWVARAKTGLSSEAKKFNLNAPKGVLIVGVQGCGKSLAAKVIGRELGDPLLKLDSGKLFDKYIGETEKNWRRAIQLAESVAPCVLWIDEIEKTVTPGGVGAEDGLSRRIFGSFLTWLQEKQDNVFVVATANDLSSLPPELQRKGRFDEVFFVDLPTAEEREEIFTIHFRLRNIDPKGFKLDALAAATAGYSGAEIEQLIVSALYDSLHAKREVGDSLAREIKRTIPLSESRREEIDEIRAIGQERYRSVRLD